MAVTLHLGAHKAASTHLQHSLRSVIQPMRAAGIHMVEIRQTRRRGLRLDAALDGRKELSANRRKWRGYLDLVADTWPRLLISDENILGSIRREGLMGAPGIYPDAPRRLGQLTAILRHRPAVACLAVRNPATFLPSAFAMLVERGGAWDFADYLGDNDPASLWWSGLAERLLSVRGIAGLIVWRYEDYAALRPAVLAELTAPDIAAQARDPEPAMVGMSQPAMDALRRRMGTDPGADVMAAARAAKAEFPRRGGYPGFDPWDGAARARIDAAYAEDTARLAALPGVRMLTLPR